MHSTHISSHLFAVVVIHIFKILDGGFWYVLEDLGGFWHEIFLDEGGKGEFDGLVYLFLWCSDQHYVQRSHYLLLQNAKLLVLLKCGKHSRENT